MTAVKPVRPPCSTPAADSMKLVTVGILGGAVHGHVVVVAGDGQRHVGLQVEVGLGSGRQRARDQLRAGKEAGLEKEEKADH